MDVSVIYFLSPGFADAVDPTVRRPYEFAASLQEAGVPTAVIQATGRTMIDRAMTERAVDADDILVVSEYYLDVLRDIAPGVPKIALNQSPRLSWSKIANIIDHPYLSTPGLRGVIALSDYDADLLRYSFPRIDIQMVTPRVTETKDLTFGRGIRNRTVCFYAGVGARPSRLLAVLGTLAARGDLKGWELQRMDGLTQRQARQCLQTSGVYLSFTEMHCMPTEELEAIICGASVVGSLSGPADYAEHMSVVAEDDTVAFASAVSRALHNFGKEQDKRRVKASSKWALEHYSAEREEAELLTALSALAPALLQPAA